MPPGSLPEIGHSAGSEDVVFVVFCPNSAGQRSMNTNALTAFFIVVSKIKTVSRRSPGVDGRAIRSRNSLSPRQLYTRARCRALCSHLLRTAQDKCLLLTTPVLL